MLEKETFEEMVVRFNTDEKNFIGIEALKLFHKAENSEDAIEALKLLERAAQPY